MVTNLKVCNDYSTVVNFTLYLHKNQNSFTHSELTHSLADLSRKLKNHWTDCDGNWHKAFNKIID